MWHCSVSTASRGPPSAQKPGLFDANKVSWPAIGFCLLSMMLSLGKKLVKPGTVIKGRISTIPQFDEFLSHTALTASHTTAQNECHCPRLYGDIFLLVLPSVDEFLSQYFSMLRRDIRASLLCRKRACLSMLELLWRVWIKYMGFKRQGILFQTLLFLSLYLSKFY